MLQNRKLKYLLPTFLMIGVFAFARKKNKMKLNNIVPFQKIRGCDGSGCGYYGASRKKRIHKGIDIITNFGEQVFSPISGKVRTLFVYYGSTEMKGVEIKDGNLSVKMFYVNPNNIITTNDYVFAGALIGYAQDIAAYHNATGIMTQHVHVEIRQNGVLVDPTLYFNINK